MPNPAWPPSLPNTFQQDGYQETEANTVIETDMETGPPKARQRSSNGPRPLSGRMPLSSAQLATFRDFFCNTLKGGALRFDWHEQLPGGDVTPIAVRFDMSQPPSWTVEEGSQIYWLTASMKVV